MKKKNGKIIAEAAIMIIMMATLARIENIKAYNEELKKDNHDYPVYTIITITLNNKTKGKIKAQVEIWNNETKQWEENKALFEQIKEDLMNVTKVIEGLENATMFEYNATFSPGCVYVVLSPSKLSNAPIVTNKTINYILSHPSEWWYVENASIETIDLYWVSLDILECYFEYYIKNIMSLMFWNYSIVNNTIKIHYLTRHNLTNGLWQYNGTMWLPNWPFIHYVNNTIKFLKSLTLLSKRNVTIRPLNDNPEIPSQSFSHPENLYLNRENISIYLDSQDGCNISDIVEERFGWIVLNTAWCDFWIHYPSSLSHDDKLCLYFTLYAIIKHLWFTSFVHDRTSIPFSADSSISSIYILFVFLLVLVIPLLFPKLRLKLKNILSSSNSPKS